MKRLLILFALIGSTASAAPTIVGTWKTVGQRCEDAGAIASNFADSSTFETETTFSSDSKFAVKLTAGGQQTFVTGKYVATESMISTYGSKSSYGSGDGITSNDSLSSYSVSQRQLVVMTLISEENGICPVGDRLITTFQRKK